MVGGVDLLGARDGTEQATDFEEALQVGFDGEGHVAGRGVGFSIEGGEKIFEGLFLVSNSEG